MGTVYRIYERTEYGVKVLAEVRDGEVTGKSAASVRKILEQHGFPYIPMEEVIDQFLLTRPGTGAAVVSPFD